MIEKTGSNEYKMSGRVDTASAKDVENTLLEQIDSSVNDLVIDLEDLTYISSAGLRIFLKVKKIIQGDIIVENVSDRVREIFELTGFEDILTIQ